MTIVDPTPTPDPVLTPPPDPDLASRLAKAEADKLAAEGRLRLLQKEHTTLKAKADSLEAGINKAESDKIASLRLRLAYDHSIPTDLFELITGSTEEEIKMQIKKIQDRLLAAPDTAPSPAPSADGTTTPEPGPAPRPAPVTQGGPSWLEKYSAADPVTRAKMDREVADGKVKPW